MSKVWPGPAWSGCLKRICEESKSRFVVAAVAATFSLVHLGTAYQKTWNGPCPWLGAGTEAETGAEAGTGAGVKGTGLWRR